MSDEMAILTFTIRPPFTFSAVLLPRNSRRCITIAVSPFALIDCFLRAYLHAPSRVNMLSPFELDLPEEIQDLIVSFCSRSSIIALCQCSKKLHRIATPRLYSDIHLQADATQSNSLLLLLPLVHLGFTSPSHASSVRAFTCEGG
jgi:hypothetical protein